jgi:pyrroloquinoline quinone biosynthesis protein B
MKRYLEIFLLVAVAGAAFGVQPANQPYTILLGLAQDGGYPQAGCTRPDCQAAWTDQRLRRHIASLGIVDPISHQSWMIDATPDFPEQLRMLQSPLPPQRERVAGGRVRVPSSAPSGHLLPTGEGSPIPLDGILLTHAHIGHYLGLAQLGREVMGTRGVPVYAMPRMKAFLEKNGPWDQLVRLGNIEIRALSHATAVQLNERISVTPLLVPHRDEYSETVAYIIQMPGKSVLWLPDIDKWEKWSTRIEDVIERVDVAYLDATFFDESELPGRNLSEIPHPTIKESMARLRAHAAKTRFIHLNQSNPVLRDPSLVERAGFRVGREGERF